LAGFDCALADPRPWGQLVRADGLDQLTAVGWAALVNHGVRTIVDLRNPDELQLRLHLPLDGQEDRAFWSAWESSWQFGTPLYYEPHLRHMPERSRAALRALIEGHCLSQVIRNFLAAAPLLAVSPAEFQRRFPVT